MGESQTGNETFLRERGFGLLPWGTSLGSSFYPGSIGDLELSEDVSKATQLVWARKKEMSAFSTSGRGPHGSCCFVQKQREDLECLGRNVWLFKLLLSQQSLLLRVAGKEPPCPGPTLFVGTIHT